MIKYCAGKKVILEGIETENDRLFAVSIDADFVQVFPYKHLFKSHLPKDIDVN